ncbi:MAG: hypothetical protein AAGF11_29020 [Myxococcota bacterium]
MKLIHGGVCPQCWGEIGFVIGHWRIEASLDALVTSLEPTDIMVSIVTDNGPIDLKFSRTSREDSTEGASHWLMKFDKEPRDAKITFLRGTSILLELFLQGSTRPATDEAADQS